MVALMLKKKKFGYMKEIKNKEINIECIFLFWVTSLFTQLSKILNLKNKIWKYDMIYY